MRISGPTPAKTAATRAGDDERLSHNAEEITDEIQQVLTVAAKMLRGSTQGRGFTSKIGGAKKKKGGKSLGKGTRVEARFMGGRRFYPGKITAENSDGTFAIAYHRRQEIYSCAFRKAQNMIDHLAD